MSNEQTNNKSVLGAVVAGVVMGAVAGILLAPKSGQETRDDLMKLADRMKGDITDRLGKLTKITTATYNEIVDVVVRQYQDTKQITSEQGQKLKDEFAKSYEAIKQAAEDEGVGNTPNATDMTAADISSSYDDTDTKLK
jgi:gas vesicle protein